MLIFAENVILQMIEVVKFNFQNKELQKISNVIRTRVFVNEQQVDPALEYEHEEESHFYLLYQDKAPIATARWRETEKGIKLERFAMLREFRNNGLGTFLLNEVLKDVRPLNKPVYLHAQLKAVNYYKRAGFVEIGQHFVEAEIEHVKMEFH